MNAVLIPSIARLINAGKEAAFGDFDADRLMKALAGAEAFVSDFEALYSFFALSLPADEKRDELARALKSLKAGLADLRKVIDRKRTFELSPVISSIEKAALLMAGALQEMKDDEAVPESPVPLINTCIRTGFNVAGGTEKPEVLIPFIPPLVKLIDSLDREIGRFRELHGEEKKTADTAEKLLGDLKEGIGALASYLKDRKPHYLADGLRLLRYPSRNLYAVLREMDRVARKKHEFSHIPALEEFYHAYEGWKSGKVKWEAVEGSLDGLVYLAALYNDLHGAIRSFPFFFSLSGPWQAVQIVRMQFEMTFKTFLESVEAQSRTIDLKAFKGSLENYSSLMHELVAAMEDEIAKVSGAPYMEELKELVGRVLAGNLVLEYFAERVQSLAQSHQTVLQEFKGARNAPGNPPEVREIYGLLCEQGEGLQEFLAFLDDSDEKHLHAGLDKIEKAMPRLMEIQKSIRTAVQEKTAKGKGPKPVCLKCGKENQPGDRRCRKCSAMLHLVIAEGGAGDSDEGEELSPLNIARMEEAVSRFEAGTAALPDLLKEIKSFINRLEGVNNEFNTRSRKAMESSSNKDLKEWASDFARLLGVMREGLETMLMVQQSPDFLYRGMSLFSGAASDLASLRQTVKASL